MKLKSLVLSLAMTVFGSMALAAATVDQPAPSFSVKDATGKVRQLSDFAGKWVVLEWYNKDCPFVKKHYGGGNMQKLQQEFTAKDVQWLTVISSAKGQQGYLEPAAAVANAKETKSNATATLIDVDGKMGHDYGAKTTPHMFVIDPKGKVVYAGAIDSDDSKDPAAIAKATNWVASALNAGMAGKKIEKTSSRPYGCSVKYQD